MSWLTVHRLPGTCCHHAVRKVKAHLSDQALIHRITLKTIILCLFCLFFEAGSRVSQAGLKLSVAKDGLYLEILLPPLLRASITGLHHHAQFMWVLGMKLRASGELTRPTTARATTPTPGRGSGQTLYPDKAPAPMESRHRATTISRKLSRSS